MSSIALPGPASLGPWLRVASGIYGVSLRGALRTLRRTRQLGRSPVPLWREQKSAAKERIQTMSCFGRTVSRQLAACCSLPDPSPTLLALSSLPQM